MMFGHWDGGWHMGWMGIGWLLLIVLIGVVVWAAARSARGSGDGGESAREILKKRYARGEIDRDAYERMSRELER